MSVGHLWTALGLLGCTPTDTALPVFPILSPRQQPELVHHPFPPDLSVCINRFHLSHCGHFHRMRPSVCPCVALRDKMHSFCFVRMDGARRYYLAQGITCRTGNRCKEKIKTFGNMNVFFIFIATKW